MNAVSIIRLHDRPVCSLLCRTRGQWSFSLFTLPDLVGLNLALEGTGYDPCGLEPALDPLIVLLRMPSSLCRRPHT